jgi:hypothetical protein
MVHQCLEQQQALEANMADFVLERAFREIIRIPS